MLDYQCVAYPLGFEDLILIFLDPVDKEIQICIWDYGVKPYTKQLFKINKTSYQIKNNCFHAFYTQVENDTKVLRGIERREKYDKLKESGKSEDNILELLKIEAPEYDSLVNSPLRDKNHEPIFAFALYYWFHAYCNDKRFAENIDKNVILMCNEYGHKNIETKIMAFKKLVNLDCSEGKNSSSENSSLVTELTSAVVVQPTTEPSNPQVSVVEKTTPWIAEQVLNPNNHAGIPFIGRKKEIEDLNNFASYHPDMNSVLDEKILFWAIVGPSGAGKTRLYKAWRDGTYTASNDPSAIKDWDEIIINHEHKAWDWTKWHPQKNTIIVIDYIFGYAKTFQSILKRFHQLLDLNNLNPLQYNIRLLIIDHIFPDNIDDLQHDLRWGMNLLGGTRFDLHDLKRFYYDELDGKPLRLDGGDTDDQRYIIETIIRNLGGEKCSNEIVSNATSYLKQLSKKNENEPTGSAWHPLFAALVGYAIQKNGDYKSFNRSQLIKYYLSGYERLPWVRTTEGHILLEGEITSAWVAAATARRGVEYKLLKEALPDNTKNELRNNHLGFDDIILICQRIVSSDKPDYLVQFEPDLLGETYFICFLEGLKNIAAPYFENSFNEMLSNGSDDIQSQDAMKFIGFIQRLARNLCNDEQHDHTVQKYWQLLFSFLTPYRFAETSLMRWSVSIALIAIFETRRNACGKDEQHWLEQVDIDKLYGTFVDFADIPICMKHYHYVSNPTHELTQKLIMHSKIFDQFASPSKQTTALMIASHEGYLKVVEALLKAGFDANASNDNSTTALMTAALEGHVDIVNTLLDYGADPNTQDEDYNYTALMYACSAGYSHLVEIMLEHKTRTINLDLQQMDEQTALMLVCYSGNLAIVNLLVSHGADLNIKDMKKCSALMHASAQGHHEVIDVLVNTDRLNINDKNTHNYSALTIACHNNRLKAVRSLLKHRYIDINTYDNYLRTPLIFASISGYEDIVLLLLEHGANRHHPSIEDKTALDYARELGHIEVFDLLLNYPENQA